eukprot:TRINITY_DN3792_c0_g2_i4.p1 TRINITY_DN3792_c0_g2~~TRINITY_DN3792_c0_g2_i4.p1  ORF type:complete len:762 (+),score=166.75 TRINITY_DN3792_c0_g2_i4:53-2338(+)
MNQGKAHDGIQRTDSWNQELANFVTYAKLSKILAGREMEEFAQCSVKIDVDSKKPFCYFLRITKLPEDPEPDEYRFPISKEMNPRCEYIGEGSSEKALITWDLEQNISMGLTFSNSPTDDFLEADRFRYLLCMLIYETVQRKSSRYAASKEEFLCYCREGKRKYVPKPVPAEEKKEERKIIDSKEYINKPDQSSKPAQIAPVTTEKKQEVKLMSKQDKENTPPLEAKEPTKPENTTKFTLTQLKSLAEQLRQDKTYIFAAPVIVFLVDIDNSVKERREGQILSIRLTESFTAVFALHDPSSLAAHYTRTIDVTISFGYEDTTICFQWLDASGPEAQLFAAKFEDISILNDFKFFFWRCRLEAMHQAAFEECLPKEEVEWASRSAREEHNPKDTKTLIEEEFKEAREIDYEEDIPALSHPSTRGDENRGVVQARLIDRTFVPKKSEIEIYKTSEASPNTLEFLMNLPAVKSFDGKSISAKKILMREQDHRMLFLNENNEEKVYYVDPERGKVISEIKSDGFNTFADVGVFDKNDEFTPNPVFLAINERNLFQIDPRQPGEAKAVKSKIYSTKNEFSTIVGVHNGACAVASRTGVIRLYKEIGQNSKNVYSSTGDVITALDASKDGKWLVATCGDHLLLIPTFVEDANGYMKNLGKEKPLARFLKLLPCDIKRYGLTQVSFTAAHFNDGPNTKEAFIVSSTGNLLVTWEMKLVFEGASRPYHLKQMAEKIVAPEFRYTPYNQSSNDLLVTLPNELRVQKTRII